MDTIIYACSVTNKMTSGSYDYYLFSRIDNYAVILKAKIDDTEYKFRVILQDEDIDTIFASANTETYLRPDQMSVQVKKYVINKMRNFIEGTCRSATKW